MSEQSAVEQRVENGKDILESDPFEDRDFFWEQHRFARDGYLKINHLIDFEVRDRISEDVKYLLANFAKRRDFLIESTGNTPRYLSNVPQEMIEAHGRYIPCAYKSRYLMSLISHIVKEDIIPTPWKWDNFIINSQHKLAIPTVGIGGITPTRSSGSLRPQSLRQVVCWSAYPIQIGISGIPVWKICWWRTK